MNNKWPNFVTILLTFLICKSVEGMLKRCISCRSRGELGSCKDPFTMNSSLIEREQGVEAVPCASGWCGKIIESPNLNNEYGTATQRMCFQRGPNDGEERCAYSVKNYKKVFMCFCSGDLCNDANHLQATTIFIGSIFICFVGTR